MQLPYFDAILSRFECGDPVFEEAFRRHIHFGVWLDPDNADVTNLADSVAAMDRMSQVLVELADVQAGQDILDVGCGFGGTLAALDEQFSPVRLTGLNIDARQVEVARRRVVPRPGNALDFVVGDACAMPFPDTSFDRVLAVECIFHFPSRRAFFEHVRRVLRPGGNLTLTDFVVAAGCPAGMFDSVIDDLLWGRNTNINLEEYRELAAEVGLVLTHHQDISAYVRPSFAFYGRMLGPYSPTARIVTDTGQLILDTGGMAYSTLRFDLPQ